MTRKLRLIFKWILFSLCSIPLSIGSAAVVDSSPARYAVSQPATFLETDTINNADRPPEKTIAAMSARAGSRGTGMGATLGLIGAGGALGASSRYLVSQWAGTVDWFGTQFPIGTLTVNILGSLGIGMMTGLSNASQAISPHWLALVNVGFLGELTTFSAFSQETVALAQSSGLAAAGSYVGVSVATTLGAALIGQQLGMWLAPVLFP